MLLRRVPLLEVDGMAIGQCVAIVNYIGRRAGMEGRDAEEFAMSQMLLAEGEDLYAAMQKFVPTVYVPLSEKTTPERNADWWNRIAPGHLQRLEALVVHRAKPAAPTSLAYGAAVAQNLPQAERFTSSGQTVGEIYLWSMLHQMRLCKPDLLYPFPQLRAFYEQTAALPGVVNVLSGNSPFGPFVQYFVGGPQAIQTSSGGGRQPGPATSERAPLSQRLHGPLAALSNLTLALGIALPLLRPYYLVQRASVLRLLAVLAAHLERVPWLQPLLKPRLYFIVAGVCRLLAFLAHRVSVRRTQPGSAGSGVAITVARPTTSAQENYLRPVPSRSRSSYE